jgi:4'-phosphopantetheinyl transferase EntD
MKLAPILLHLSIVVAASLTPRVDTSQERLFPEGVILVTRRNLVGEMDLFPEELQAMSRAVPARLHEFALGRHCARIALAQLGGPHVAIPVGRFRDPMWPFGYIGSITHCRGFCAAAVARVIPGNVSRNIRGIGLDCEPSIPLPEELPGLVCSEEECAWLASRQGDHLPWDRLFFCAKESAYKCVFPTSHQFLEFRDLGVRFTPEQGTFTVSLPDLGPNLPRSLMGRYTIGDEFLLAATTWTEEPGCP